MFKLSLKFKSSPTIILLNILFIMFPDFIHAQYSADQSSTGLVSGGTFYLGIPYSTFNEQAKEQQGVGDGIGILSLGCNIFLYDYLLVGAEIGWDSPDDLKEFTNLTTEGELSSSVSVWQTSILAGINLPNLYLTDDLNPFLSMNISGGYMWAFFEDRSITNCIDCDHVEVDISGGIFVKPELYYVFDIFALGFGYRYYFNSDYKSKYELKIAGFMK